MVVGDFSTTAAQPAAAGHQPSTYETTPGIPVRKKSDFHDEEDYYDAIFMYNVQMWNAKLVANGIKPFCLSSADIPMKTYVYPKEEDNYDSISLYDDFEYKDYDYDSDYDPAPNDNNNNDTYPDQPLAQGGSDDNHPTFPPHDMIHPDDIDLCSPNNQLPDFTQSINDKRNSNTGKKTKQNDNNNTHKQITTNNNTSETDTNDPHICNKDANNSGNNAKATAKTCPDVNTSPCGPDPNDATNTPDLPFPQQDITPKITLLRAQR